jgi:hypothetical protein
MDIKSGEGGPATRRLAHLYGRLRWPEVGSDPHVFSNFVTTLHGVVSLRMRGHANGRDISGCNDQDRVVMGLLRAVADVVIVGAGTLVADRQHVWTPETIYPALASDDPFMRRVAVSAADAESLGRATVKVGSCHHIFKR